MRGRAADRAVADRGRAAGGAAQRHRRGRDPRRRSRSRPIAKALDHILVNLIDNGVKYTPPDGHVWVEARADGDDVRIEVRDDGPGIADKHRERVFERFYRADPSRSREAGGTGLGLSIVKHLVESMGGEVGVEPNAPQGSIFWLRLPRRARTSIRP